MGLVVIIIAVIIYFTIGGFLQGLFGSNIDDDGLITCLWPVVVPYILANAAGEKLAQIKFKRRNKR